MPAIIEARLREHGGAARRAWLVRTRSDAYRLADAVGCGMVRRVAHGIFALPGTPKEVVSAVVHNARLGCLSALSRAGVAVLRPPDEPHLAVDWTRGRRPSVLRNGFPVVIHREHAVADGLVSVTVASALARALVCRPDTEALVSVDSALNKRLVTLEDVRALVPQDAVRSQLALTLADGHARSPLETVARLALVGAGLEVRAGVVIPKVGEVDLLVGGQVVVELDGYAFHSDRSAFQEDRRRDRELALQGYVVLRFTADEVLREPWRVVAAVRAALATARRTPPRV